MFDVTERQPPPLSVAEIVDGPDQAAAWVAVQAPGPDAVAALSMLDAGRLSPAGRVDALVAWERQVAWLQARQQRVLAAMADDVEHATGPVQRLEGSWVREDVACALRLSGVSAQRRLVAAQALADRLPATLRLLDRGAITYLHALSLAEATYGLDDQTTSAVERDVLGRAGEQTLAAFKRSITRAVAALAPARVEEQRVQAMGERRVCVSPREDGMAELWALLPAEGAAAVLAAVDALASVTSADDERSADQRRADALVDLGVAALHDPLLPTAQGMRPAVQVTVALSTLLGADEQPAELAGHGPIPASVARRIAADETGTWRRLLTDPTGQLLDYGTQTYRPPADLSAFVIARDQHCTFPTCHRPAHRCNLDHEVPASAGGPTNPTNLAALCRRHHRAKHHAGWNVTRHDTTGQSEWTSPTGHRYTSRPPDYPKDSTDPTAILSQALMRRAASRRTNGSGEVPAAGPL